MRHIFMTLEGHTVYDKPLCRVHGSMTLRALGIKGQYMSMTSVNTLFESL